MKISLYFLLLLFSSIQALAVVDPAVLGAIDKIYTLLDMTPASQGGVLSEGTSNEGLYSVDGTDVNGNRCYILLSTRDASPLNLKFTVNQNKDFSTMYLIADGSDDENTEILKESSDSTKLKLKVKTNRIETRYTGLIPNPGSKRYQVKVTEEVSLSIVKVKNSMQVTVKSPGLLFNKELSCNLDLE